MKQNQIPELSHLQYAVLRVLGASEMRGKDLRRGLYEEWGIRKGGPAFYQLMDRLEEAKFVEGWPETHVVDGQTIKQRHYRVTASGRMAANNAFNFYASKPVPDLLAPFGLEPV